MGSGKRSSFPIFSLFLCVILCLFLSLYSLTAASVYKMIKRLKKDSKTYYIVLNNAQNSVSIHTTQSSVTSFTGICRTTLYKNFLRKSIYNNGVYTVWYDVVMYKCNKDGNANLFCHR